jgi:outer membrane beta-barrel protein
MRPRHLALFLIAAPASALAQEDATVERIHVVEKRPFTEAGRFELSLFGPVQVNPKFTMHAGVGAEIAYHLRENLAVQFGTTWFAFAVQSGLSEELAAKVSQAPVAADALLVQADALAGLELMPVYGKFDVFDGKILRIGLYLNAGLGVAKTRLQLRPPTAEGGRSFGDTGFRPEAGLGVGFRIFVSERFTVRLELRDRVYSAYVSKVNGCTFQDAHSIHENGSSATGLSGGCSASSFGGSENDIKSAAASAEDQLRQPSAGIVNHLAVQGGVSWLF